MGMLRLLKIFLVGCAAAAAAGACAADCISTEAERGAGYCFFRLRFCPLHCDASDVYSCCCSWLLLFLPLDCDASVMVDDYAAVETGCMLEKYIPAEGCNKIRAHFYLLVEVLLLLLRAAAAAHNISTQVERGITFSFLVAALLLLFTHREGCAEKKI